VRADSVDVSPWLEPILLKDRRFGCGDGDDKVAMMDGILALAAT
jgi:hypothetical protein